MKSSELALAEEVMKYVNDPYGFIMFAFPWGKGVLQGYSGPDKWQTELLTKIKDVLEDDPFDGFTPVKVRQFAVTSGHGVGKSALSAMIMIWLISTRPMSKGVVTANTVSQLRSKTWAELKKWLNMSITGHWFDYYNSSNTLALRHHDFPNEWKVEGFTCKEENSESFAGLHESGSSPWYLFDEASGVPNKIWEVSDGGKTDGEPFHFVFGNPTRGTGRFYDCFNRLSHRWHTYKVDSRNSSITNKGYIEEMIEDWGEDSDYIRVRVRGEFPKASDFQLISSDWVQEATTRESFILPNEPLIIGVDVARGGNDYGVIQARRGNDARSYPKMKIPGKLIHDGTRFTDMIVAYCEEHNPTIVNVDGVGMGGFLHDRLKQLGIPSRDIVAHSKPIRTGKFKDKSAEMWYNMREWIKTGGCIKKHDQELINQLEAREYLHDDMDRLVLQSKKDMKKAGLHSPDDADALALTFATPIATSQLKTSLLPKRKKARIKTYSRINRR